VLLVVRFTWQAALHSTQENIAEKQQKKYTSKLQCRKIEPAANRADGIIYNSTEVSITFQ